MKKLDDLVPAGLSARREIGWVLAAYALAGLWSLTFLVRYFGRRENLFTVEAGRETFSHPLGFSALADIVTKNLDALVKLALAF